MSCLAALIVSGFAGCVAMAVIVYCLRYKPDMLLVGTLAATVIRLLLMIAGSAVVILFAKVNILWFAVWIGVFYLVTLVLEMCFTIRAANRNKVSGGCKA